jgi:hypothetical protein
MTTKYFETKEQYLTFRNAWAKAAQSKTLTAAHFMLYNIIRGKDPQDGFTPFQRRSKFDGMGMFNLGAVMANQELRRMQSRIGSKYGHEWAVRFVEPFGDAFTLEDLKKIEIPKVEQLWTVFGKGMRIAKNIPEEFKAKTINELLALDTEEAA